METLAAVAAADAVGAATSKADAEAEVRELEAAGAVELAPPVTAEAAARIVAEDRARDEGPANAALGGPAVEVSANVTAVPPLAAAAAGANASADATDAPPAPPSEVLTPGGALKRLRALLQAPGNDIGLCEYPLPRLAALALVLAATSPDLLQAAAAC